jgi:TonB family protein
VDSFPTNLVVQFVVVIQPSGKITARRMYRSSGIPEYDRSVELAIERSSFPPMPAAFNGQPDNPLLLFSLDYLYRK